MFSWAQMWLFNILIPTIMLILFTTWVNRWILFSSNVKQPWAGKKLWEFFKKSKFLPEECTYLSQICLLKSELHTGQTGIMLSIDCLFFLTRWQNNRQILECMVMFMSQAVRNVSFTIIIFLTSSTTRM